MNLFDLHADKSKLKHHNKGHKIPEVMWERIRQRGSDADEIKSHEELWLTDPKFAYKYARFLRLYHHQELADKRDKLEDVISKSGKWSLEYALDRMEKFPKGEPEIAKNGDLAVLYAQSILVGRFKAGEAAIAQDPKNAYTYALRVLHGPFKEGEPAIQGDKRYADRYFKEVIARHRS